jgi:hypothetical protein
VSATLVRLLGMRRAAWLLAVRLFPEPWQRAIRTHAAAVVGAVPASTYLGLGLALAHWAIGSTAAASSAMGPRHSHSGARSPAQRQHRRRPFNRRLTAATAAFSRGPR